MDLELFLTGKGLRQTYIKLNNRQRLWFIVPILYLELAGSLF
jgi:hypothetical protein